MLAITQNLTNPNLSPFLHKNYTIHNRKETYSTRFYIVSVEVISNVLNANEYQQWANRPMQ